MLGLPRRRDAQVEGGGQRNGHAKRLRKSLAWPKEFIEEVAEPRFEHVELGVGDRHAPGPIVRDGPGLKVVLGRPADVGPRLQSDVKIVRHNAQAGRGAPERTACLYPAAPFSFPANRS